jgi:hypothetical protein
MSKTQYTLLAAFVAFYAVLLVSLLVRACAGYLRARRPALPKVENISKTFAMARSRAWTRAVWRGNLIEEMRRIEQTATAPSTSIS